MRDGRNCRFGRAFSCRREIGLRHWEKAVSYGASSGSQVRRVDGLELDQDLAFQRREWVAERVGWFAIAALLVAALLGVFGTGPFSSASSGGALVRIDYERFGRRLAPVELRIRLGEDASQGGVARMWIAHDYLDSVHLEGITPEPDATEARADRIVFAFAVADGGPGTVAFHMRPDSFGVLSGRVGVVDGPELRFWQFIYP